MKDCCPTCNRTLPTPRRKITILDVDLSGLSDDARFAHYKRIAPVEDIRFALRIGVTMPGELAIAWTALLRDAENGLPPAQCKLRLRALQARWRILQAETEKAEGIPAVSGDAPYDRHGKRIDIEAVA